MKKENNKYILNLETDFKSIKDGESFSWTINDVEIWVSTQEPEPHLIINKKETA